VVCVQLVARWMVRVIWEGIVMVDDGKLPRMTVYCGAQSCGTFRVFLL